MLGGFWTDQVCWKTKC